ncbi:MAG: hypothetical protein PHE60_00800 [Sulfurospirillaceae bacterium]|nr:hypothetical protein [Sulfurospirillaceae bacterium]
MLIIGYPSIPYTSFYQIKSIAQIAQTPSNGLLLFDFDIKLCTYANTQNLSFALHVKNIKELVLANALGAKYFIVDKSLAINAQKVADDYLFGGKIMLSSTDESDIEFVALNAIDGIIFEESIKSL